MKTAETAQQINRLIFLGEETLSHCGVPEPRVDAEVLLSHVLGLNRTKLFIYADRYVDEYSKKQYINLISKRVSRIPVNYLISKKEFMGLEFRILPGVFIPRPETELIVEETLKIIQQFNNPTILDIGTGSGNIAISLAIYLEKTKIYATDISLLCIKVAEFNAKLHNVKNTTFLTGNLYDPIRVLGLEKKFSLIVSNPPYISRNEFFGLQREILYEPRIAIDGGHDGLRFYHRIIRGSKLFISDNGFVVVEIGYNQKEEVCDIFLKEGYRIRHIKKDYSGFDRVIIAQWTR